MISPRRPLAFLYDRRDTPTRAVTLVRIETCRQYADAQGWDVAGDWIDEGEAALTDRRPEFDILISKMLGAHRGGREVVCLVTDFGRLSSNPETRARFVKRVHLVGGRIETIAGERSDDRTGRLTGAPLS